MSVFYEKRVGAPTGTINISAAGTNFTLDDTTNRTISTDSAAVARALDLNAFVQRKGSNQPYVAPTDGGTTHIQSPKSVIFSQASASAGTSGYYTFQESTSVVKVTLTAITAPNGSSFAVQLLKNGSSFATASLPSGSVGPVTQTLSTSFAVGDHLSVNCTSTGGAKNVVVQVEVA